MQIHNPTGDPVAVNVNAQPCCWDLSKLCSENLGISWLMKQKYKSKDSMRTWPSPIRAFLDSINHNYKPVERFVACICK